MFTIEEFLETALESIQDRCLRAGTLAPPDENWVAVDLNSELLGDPYLWSTCYMPIDQAETFALRAMDELALLAEVAVAAHVEYLPDFFSDGQLAHAEPWAYLVSARRDEWGEPAETATLRFDGEMVPW